MKLGKITSMVAVLFIFVMTSAFASAAADDIDVRYVKVDGEELDQDKNERISVPEDLDIKVRLEALANVSDVEVTARVTGYEYSERAPLRTYDVVVFKELTEDDVTTARLNLEVPKDILQQERQLLVQIYSADGQISETYEATLNIQGQDNFVDIRRVTFDPAQVVSGRALRTNLRLENLGERDENDVYATVAIPELGEHVKTSTNVDTLRAGRLTTTEDLLLRIPDCVEPGEYEVDVTVSYDNDYKTEKTTEYIEIVESTDECDADEVTDKTVITAPDKREIKAGTAKESFPIVIKNEGNQDKTYVVSVSGVDSWGSYDISNAAPFVQAGSSQVVYVYIDANIDAENEKTFTVSVADGNDVKDIPVNVNVMPADDMEDERAFDWKQWLYAGVIVLLILIVILGLAIGFKKVSNEDDEEYY